MSNVTASPQPNVMTKASPAAAAALPVTAPTASAIPAVSVASAPASAPAPASASASASASAPAPASAPTIAPSGVCGAVSQGTLSGIKAPEFHSEEGKKPVIHPISGSDHTAHQPSKPAIYPSVGAATSTSTSATAQIPKHQHYTMRENLNGALWTLTTSKSWKFVCEELPIQVAAHKFSVVGKHDLRDSLSKKGMKFDDEVMIFELCNAQIASNVLTTNVALSAVLPCRISVTAKYGEDGCAIHLFLPTTLLSNCFDQVNQSKHPFQGLAENITSTLKEIAKKAAK